MCDCIFCKIIDRQIPSNIVYEDDKVLAFHDIHPVAPVHVLVIPKKHIESLNDINSENVEYVSAINLSIPKIAKKLNIFDYGYRVITNILENGGQEVLHLHYHILGGKKLGSKIVKE